MVLLDCIFFFSQCYVTRKKLEFSQKELTLSFWTPLNLQASSPFGGYRVKYTCSHVARFTRPNRRACSQARHPLEQKYALLLTTFEVKMAQYCPSFFFGFLLTKTKLGLRWIIIEKKNRQIYIQLSCPQAKSIKDLLWATDFTFSCGSNAGNPERAS